MFPRTAARVLVDSEANGVCGASRPRIPKSTTPAPPGLPPTIRSLGKEHGVDHMDYAVDRVDVGADDLGSTDHHGLAFASC